MAAWAFSMKLTADLLDVAPIPRELDIVQLERGQATVRNLQFVTLSWSTGA